MASGGNNRLSIDQVKCTITSVHGINVIIDESSYEGPKKRARFIDIDHGEWWVQPRQVFKGSRHPNDRLQKKKQKYIESINLDLGCHSYDDPTGTIYGYADFTCEEKSRCFYVGQGSFGRIKNFARNNKHTATKRRLGLKRTVLFKTHDSLIINEWETNNIASFNTFTMNYHFDGRDIGCNLVKLGGSKRGHKDSEETCQRKKLAAKKNAKDPVYRQKLSAAQKKRYENPEERRKTGLKSCGHVCSEDERKKHSESAKLQWKNDEQRQKLLTAIQLRKTKKK